MIVYFLEIKYRITLLILTCLSTIIICYYYKEVLLFSVISCYINYKSELNYFIFTHLTEIFSVYLELIMFFSFQIILGYILYHLFVFFSPSLYIFEYKYIRFFFRVILFFLFFSGFFSNYILIPVSLNFFISFQNFIFGQFFYFEAKLTEYFSFYLTAYYFCFVYCQIFSLLFFFLRDVYAKELFIKKFRKLYYYAFLVFSTQLSPPEILNQILISLLLIIIYELVILSFMYIISISRLIR